MIRVRQVKIPVEKDTEETIKNTISKLLKVPQSDIKQIIIKKKSLDAREKPNLFYSYILDLDILNEKHIFKKNKSKDISISPKEEYKFTPTGTKKLQTRPIVVGSGPSGLLCAYFLALHNYNPIVIERGDDVDNRIKKVEEFFATGNLDTNSNIQFGEGGAGTFSDGKLNTLIKDKEFRQKKIFEIFVENGAPKEILYSSTPHIGTDILRVVVKNIRKKIITMGGTFHFNKTLTNIFYEDNKLTSIEINNKEIIKTNILVLAIGHSARDTFNMLYNKKIEMIPKPFAIGLRIIHSQKLINENQYGKNYYQKLPPANYKLTYQASNKRGVYTFCMCPGGYVVNASSENKLLAINGMSNYKRESPYANSAVIVTISPSDFGNTPLAGLNYQQELEQKAYQLGNGKIPIQYYNDFKEGKVTIREVPNIFKGDYKFSNLDKLFSKDIKKSLIEGIDYFDTKIKGFKSNDTLLAGVESRTSSPLRILRDETLNSNIKGIYPTGEGAGYAGGITSSAIDGVKVFEEITKIYQAN